MNTYGLFVKENEEIEAIKMLQGGYSIEEAVQQFLGPYSEFISEGDIHSGEYDELGDMYTCRTVDGREFIVEDLTDL